jgi:hypothetical protein
MSLQHLLQAGLVWRGDAQGLSPSASPASRSGVATGHAALDAALPTGGWPRGALTEILHAAPGQGEVQLLLPALASLSQAQRYIAFIDPPWQPYAPALSLAGIDTRFLITLGPLAPADRLWALEQLLRSEHCGAALIWPCAMRQTLGTKTLRRLQLAAEAGHSCGFLLRSPRCRGQHSPAALRADVHPTDEGGLQVALIKCRGRSLAAAPITLPNCGG